MGNGAASFFFPLLCGLLLLGGGSLYGASEEEGITELKSLALYVGLHSDYDLPLDLRKKNLSFEGTYKRYTALQYNKKAGVIRFKPKRVGLGVLNIKDASSGQILKKLNLRVRKTDLQETAREVQALLKTVDGVGIKILNNRVVVDGEIVVPRDMRRVHAVVKEYGGKVGSLVTLSPLAQQKLAKFMEKEINNPKITVDAKNMSFILKGQVESQVESDNAAEIAALYLPDYITDLAIKDSKVKEVNRNPIINQIVVKEKKPEGPRDDRKKLIQLIVHYVELNKDYSNSFRFHWNPGLNDGSNFSFYTGSSGLAQIGGMISGTISNFIPKLNWAKAFGFARILHTANVTTENGATAKINTVKEIPYFSTKSESGDKTTDKASVTMNLSMTPHIQGPMKDSIRLSKVTFTITNIVGTGSAGPITNQRTVDTAIHVQNGLSAVLGGAISNLSFTDYNREPPGSSPNPILSFLSAKKFNRSQNQFVVFITPIIKASASSGVHRIKKKFHLYSEK